MGVLGATRDIAGWSLQLAVAVALVPVVAIQLRFIFVQHLETSAHLDAVAQSSSAVFWEIDPATGRMLSVSNQIVKVLGYHPEELAPTLLDHVDRRDHRRLLDVGNSAQGSNTILDCRFLHRDGSIVWLRLHLGTIPGGGNGTLKGIAFDITELVEAREIARIQAETDALTGLANRSVLVRSIEEHFNNEAEFALLVLDVNDFKELNDTLGHQAGDEFLKEMARRLEATVPAGSTVARMGGDEFAIVLPVHGGLVEVMAQSAALVSELERCVVLAGLEYVATSSCGVAISVLHAANGEDLLRRADLAMYVSKRNGFRVHLFDFASDEVNVNRLTLSADAESALQAGHLQLWFQPKIDLLTNRVVGAEGLIRWHHPVRGVLMPSEFLQMIELSRHRALLTREVIHQGAAFAARARMLGFQLPIAVNVSVQEFLEAGFVRLVQQALATFSVPSGLLIVEVTEREIMDDRVGFVRTAEALRDSGVGLAIDDFGTGQSSLLRLHQLPVTELKIDRTLVNRLGRDTEAEGLVTSIIHIAQSLGQHVVAEGVETDIEVAVLRRLGCPVGQGFLFAAALPGDDFTAMLETTGTRVPVGPATAADVVGQVGFEPTTEGL